MDKTKLKYKLIDHDGYTRRGLPGETYWLDGKEKVAARAGAELCTASLIHYYDDPYLATLFNPIHANIDNPRLIIIKIDKQHASDGLKGGCKKAKYTKEVKLPKISVIQKVTFAIKVSLECYKDEEFEKWAINWLNGNDRTASAAGAAAGAAGAAAGAAWAAASAGAAARAAAGAAARAAAEAAGAAARAAAEAAGAAAGAAARAAAEAAGAAAGAARAAAEAAWAAASAGAAGAAAEAAGAAARAAAEAAEAAARAAWVAKSNRFFIKTIREVIKNGQN